MDLEWPLACILQLIKVYELHILEENLGNLEFLEYWKVVRCCCQHQKRVLVLVDF